MGLAIIGLFDEVNEAQAAMAELKGIGIPVNQVTSLQREGSPGGPEDDDSWWARLKEGLKEMFGAGVPKGDLPYYREGLRRGGILVSARVDDDEEEERVLAIFQRHRVVDLEERAEQWRASGWTETLSSEQEQVVPIIEEELQVGKRTVQRGGVRVYTHVVERPVEESVTLREEQVRVERRPADRPATEADLLAGQQGTIEVTETAEEPVVSKRVKVVGDVVVKKDVRARQDKVKDTVRRTEIEVGRPTGPSEEGRG